MLDIVIANGLLVDGTGSLPVGAEIGIAGDRIVQITDPGNLSARRRIDADNMVVAPGFIDIHAHSDLDLLRPQGGWLKLRQGVTTDVIGNCGLAPVPVVGEERAGLATLLSAVLGELEPWDWTDIPSYLDVLDRAGLSMNVAVLAAHGSIRRRVMGLDPAPPTSARWTMLESILQEALAAGCWGLSTGLGYPPASFADDDELARLGAITARQGGYLAVHMRNEGAQVIPSLQAMVRVARHSGVPLQISHLKAYGRNNWSKTAAILTTVEEARAEGIDITFDSYPYLMGSTTLTAILPPWLSEGGEPVARLSDPTVRARVLHQLRNPLPDQESYTDICGWEGITYAGGNIGRYRELEGQNLVEIAAVMNTDPAEASLALMEGESGTASMLIYGMREDSVRQIMSHPLQMVGSDGLYNSLPHPRVAGTFPRILGTYVREAGLFSLEQAVHKMSGRPAARLGLKDRGVIVPGAFADLVIFDPAKVAEGATITSPTTPPVGIIHVLVNGVPVISNREVTTAQPGRLLRRGQG